MAVAEGTETVMEAAVVCAAATEEQTQITNVRTVSLTMGNFLTE